MSQIIKDLVRHVKRTLFIAPFCMYKIGQLLFCDFINLHKILSEPKQRILKENKIQIT